MSEHATSIKKAIPIIVVTWILCLISSLALVYVAPSIFPPLNSANISTEAIITTKLSDGAVTSAKILDGTISAQDIADGSIIAVKVADSAVTTIKIADESVTAPKLADGAIVSIKLADGSVNSAKILDGAVTAVDLADGSVTNINIADGAVTTEKIADEAVTNIKLAANAIPFNATYDETVASTSSTSYSVIPGMSATITLNRTSHVLIMFSGEAWMSAGGDYLLVRALVNSTIAYPDSGEQIVLTRAAQGNHGSNSFIFYLPNVSAGSYTVEIEWRVWTTGNTAYIEARTLNIIALPT